MLYKFMNYINKYKSNKYLDNTLKHNLLFFDRYIDKVIYINLEEAVERNNTIINNLKEYFHDDKIIRLNAIKNKYKGATQSHIECLDIAIKNNWKNVLIVEDDAVLVNKNFYNLEKIINNNFDVIQLGATFPLYNPFTYKLYSSYSGTAYIVNNKYFKTLKNHYIEGLEKINNALIKKLDHSEYIFDSYWRILQIKDNWKIIYPPIFIQFNNYSYVNEKEMVHENSFYDSNIYFLKKRLIMKLKNFFFEYIDKYINIYKKRSIIYKYLLLHYLYLNMKVHTEITKYIINFPILLMFFLLLFLYPLYLIINDHIKYIID